MWATLATNALSGILGGGSTAQAAPAPQVIQDEKDDNTMIFIVVGVLIFSLLIIVAITKR